MSSAKISTDRVVTLWCGRNPFGVEIPEPAGLSMDQNLQEIGAFVGEEIGVVRVGGTKDSDHPGQCRVGARAHVKWGGGQQLGTSSSGRDGAVHRERCTRMAAFHADGLDKGSGCLCGPRRRIADGGQATGP